MLLRQLALLLAVAVALSSPAAEVKLGPETPIVLVRVGPAAYFQDGMIASNGREFLAVWRDTRERAADGDLYAARLDSEGRVVELFGHRVARGRYPIALASNGQNYLAISPADSDPHGHNQFSAFALDADGNAIGAERLLDTPQVLGLASNGSSYLMIASVWDSAAHTRARLGAVLVDSSGTTLAVELLDMDSNSMNYGLPLLAVNNGRYDVLGYPTNCNLGCTPVLKTFEVHGASMTSRATSMPVPLGAAVAITADRLLFAWPGAQDQVFVSIVDRAGHTVLPTTVAATLPGASASYFSVNVYWDGREFLLAATTGYGVVRTKRMASDGAVVSDDWRLLSSSTIGHPPRFVTNGETAILHWVDTALSSAGDFVERTLHGFDDLAGVSNAPAVIAWSGRAQRDVHIASMQAGVMAVWRDEDAHEILGAVRGVQFSIDAQPSGSVGPPSITTGQSRFLVAWYERNGSKTRMLARRYSFGGLPIDAAPLVIVPDFNKAYLDNAPGVAADDGSVVFTDDSEPGAIRLLRLDVAGGTVTEIGRVATATTMSSWGSLRPMKTVSHWIVPYFVYYGFFSPHIDVSWSFALSYLPLSGGDGPAMHDLFCGYASQCTRTGFANAGDAVLLTSPRQGFLSVHAPDPAGAPRPNALPQTNTPGPADIDLAWNGSEFVAVWTTYNGGPIRAMRLDARGNALDSVPIEIAAEGSNLYSQPSIAVTDDGVIIAYTRAARENGGAPRAFMRTLERLPPLVPRRRATRH